MEKHSVLEYSETHGTFKSFHSMPIFSWWNFSFDGIFNNRFKCAKKADLFFHVRPDLMPSNSTDCIAWYCWCDDCTSNRITYEFYIFCSKIVEQFSSNSKIMLAVCLRPDFTFIATIWMSSSMVAFPKSFISHTFPCMMMVNETGCVC